MPTIRAFLVDAHEVSRRGLAAMLAVDPQIRVVGEAETAEQAERRVLAVRPDVVVVADARLCALLCAGLPSLRCLVLGQDTGPDAMAAAARAGAAGYLVKDVRTGQLVAAVRRVAAGQTLFDPAAVAPPPPGLNGHRRVRLGLLSDRERQVLALLGEGLSNREIAERLYLHTKTVKNYVSSLLGKLNLGNRTQAAVLATQLRSGDASPCL